MASLYACHFVGKMRAAFPRASFSWYADEAHYQAEPPEDHTPFSYTGWPLPNPYPVVFATDVMHRPDLGVDCNVLFAYWLAEAKAGRMPWLKYLIWQRKLYSVRSNWVPQANSGHDDHVHLSARTDHKDTSLGAWSPAPGTATSEEDDDMHLDHTPNGSIGVIDGYNAAAHQPFLYWQTDATRCQEWVDAGVPIKHIGHELTAAYWDWNGPDPTPLTLDDATMAKLLAGTAAAAKEGAEAGVDDALDGATVTTTIDTPEQG
jgi:hypothetical protein